jgi:hypothetical protein
MPSRRSVAEGRTYLEAGRPVQVLITWSGRGPHNALIRREDGTEVVRPFRGLRRLQPPQEAPESPDPQPDTKPALKSATALPRAAARGASASGDPGPNGTPRP